MEKWPFSRGILMVALLACLIETGISQTVEAEQGKTAETGNKDQLQSELRDVVTSWASAWWQAPDILDT